MRVRWVRVPSVVGASTVRRLPTAAPRRLHWPGPAPHGPADGTPPAARRQRPHLPRLLRPHRPAADDVEGRARHGRVRLHQHRAARDPGREAGSRRGRLRPRQADLPPRAIRGVQGQPDADAGRHAGADPQGAGGRQGAGDPGLRARGLRGRRRDRDAGGPGRGARLRDHHPHRRPGHAPARERAHPADGVAARRDREHRRLRPGEDRRPVGPAAGPDARLQGAQGRSDRQHPGHPRGGGEDRLQADRHLGVARQPVPASRRGDPREAAPAACRPQRVGPREPGADAPRPRRRRQPGSRRRASGGVRPRGGGPAVPRVRVPDADRPAAAAVGRAPGGRDPRPARGARRGVPGGPGRRSWRRDRARRTALRGARRRRDGRGGGRGAPAVDGLRHGLGWRRRGRGPAGRAGRDTRRRGAGRGDRPGIR